MAYLLGPLTEPIERQARHWFALLNEREWTPVHWRELTDAEKRALDRLCVCGVAQQRMREVLEVNGVEHAVRVVVSGDCAERLRAEHREQLVVRFGLGRSTSTEREMELEAVRLTTRGQAIRDGDDSENALLTALAASYFPAPGCVEWLGWETIGAKTDSESSQTVASPETPPTQTKSKRSTERGEGRLKLIAALTKHHKYADGSCLNLEPVGNNELARQAEVSESTASAFFNNEFNRGESGGYATYRVICRDPGRLADSLKALNGEFSPHHLFGRSPPGERERGGEE